MESLCRNCGTPDSWHSEDDGQCPDDDGPHYDSAAAYDARELTSDAIDHDAGLCDDCLARELTQALNLQARQNRHPVEEEAIRAALLVARASLER